MPYLVDAAWTVTGRTAGDMVIRRTRLAVFTTRGVSTTLTPSLLPHRRCRAAALLPQASRALMYGRMAFHVRLTPWTQMLLLVTVAWRHFATRLTYRPRLARCAALAGTRVIPLTPPSPPPVWGPWSSFFTFRWYADQLDKEQPVAQPPHTISNTPPDVGFFLLTSTALLQRNSYTTCYRTPYSPTLLPYRLCC